MGDCQHVLHSCTDLVCLDEAAVVLVKVAESLANDLRGRQAGRPAELGGGAWEAWEGPPRVDGW